MAADFFGDTSFAKTMRTKKPSIKCNAQPMRRAHFQESACFIMVSEVETINIAHFLMFFQCITISACAKHAQAMRTPCADQPKHEWQRDWGGEKDSERKFVQEGNILISLAGIRLAQRQNPTGIQQNSGETPILDFF